MVKLKEKGTVLVLRFRKPLQITTPSKRYLEFGYLQTKPFYREPWFLVALAAASIVIIIMVVAILCVKSKSYKYKGEQDCMVGFKDVGRMDLEKRVILGLKVSNTSPSPQ